MKFVVENEKQLIAKIYTVFQGKLKAGFRIGLVGDLGAGKTALVRGILKKLGVKEPVTSPTFILRKLYRASNGLKIQHIDLYRQDKSAPSQEIEEWLNDKDYLTFVEWPENLRKSSVLFDIIIKLVLLNQKSRKVEVIWN